MVLKEKCVFLSVFKFCVILQACAISVRAQMMGGMTGQADPVLAQAVREVVHPMARPSRAMIALANRNMGPPTTVGEMMQYTPHMVQLARHFGVRPQGTIGNPSQQALYQYMLERGFQWLQRQQGTGQTAGGGFQNMLMWSMMADLI